eukprot:1303604-Amphidinium_carterae.1
MEADEVANLGASVHAVHEPSAEYLRWEIVAKAVRSFWLMVVHMKPGQECDSLPQLRKKLLCPPGWTGGASTSSSACGGTTQTRGHFHSLDCHRQTGK